MIIYILFLILSKSKNAILFINSNKTSPFMKADMSKIFIVKKIVLSNHVLVFLFFVEFYALRKTIKVFLS